LEGVFLKLFRIGHDNTVTTRTDLVGRVVSMTDTAGNAAVTREYAYDSLARPVTRRTARQGNTVNDSFACNSRSELTAAAVSGKTYGYSYDNIGNRKTAREDAEEATAYTTGPLNQYTAIERGEEAAFEPVHGRQSDIDQDIHRHLASRLQRGKPPGALRQ